MSGVRLALVPMTLRDAREYVRQLHRNHPPPVGGLFAVGCAVEGRIVGVAVVGNPSARLLDDAYTAEVTRLCTDGTRNACSLLYGACWRAARALGYRRLVTYTLASEPGTSLRAAGWREVARVRAQSWHRAGRPRVEHHSPQAKIRWEAAP